MRIGIPSETKTLEGRVALVPAAAADLVRHGHEVFIQSGAGLQSGFADEDYVKAGITIVPDAAALYEAGELIVKVKEPIAGDLALLRKDHLLFCYLHLAAEPDVDPQPARHRPDRRGVRVGRRPRRLAAARADVDHCRAHRYAGRHHLLHRPQGGKGKLLGGMASTERGKVVVLGAGAAGGNAAALAAAAGANVVVFDKRQDRLAEMMELGPNVTALYPYEESRRREVRDADLVVGAVLMPSAKAPHVVTRGDGQDDGAGQRAGRHLDRPGRLLRDLEADHLEGADL